MILPSILSVTGLQGSIYDLTMFFSESEPKMSIKPAAYLFLFTDFRNQQGRSNLLKNHIVFYGLFVLVLKMKMTLIYPFCPIPYNNI